MSYSRLNTFDMCQAMYFYNYIQKVPQEFGPAAVTGNILHSTLEDVVGDTLDFDQTIEIYEKHISEYDPEGKISQELIDAGHEMLSEFIDRHQDDQFNVVGKELPFELIIGSALIIGFIDLVTDEKDYIKVTDYKSGKYEVTAKSAPTNLQLGIYALAVSQLFPDRDVYAELYYLRSGRRKGHLFSAKDLEQVYKEVLEKINTIINTVHFKVTDAERPACYFCDYARPEVCKAGVYKRSKKKW